MEEAIQVETLREQPQTASLPAFQPEPKLDEAQVRAAIAGAAKSGVDPFTLTVDALNRPPEPPAQAETLVEVPEKFKKPNGEVDVEKLKTSVEDTREAVLKKEEKLQEVQKSVEDYLLEQKALEKRLSSTPNPEKLAAKLGIPEIPQPTASPSEMTNEQLEQMINQDVQRNPARTIAQLVQLGVQKELNERLKPIEEEKRDNTIRDNIKKIASLDPRILNETVFKAVNAKLAENPELWNLKNPHKAAFLEVKEDLHLGELNASAQPSKSFAPVLGGGTPPPAPSSSPEGVLTSQTLEAAVNQLSFDPRNGKVDKKQQDALDRAAKEFFDRQDRSRR